ncbi:MAG: hypothetical protein P8165_09440 [Deltaproteobacteria bacterium]
MCDQPQHPLSDAREGRTREAHGFSGMMSRETSPLSLAIMRGSGLEIHVENGV